MATVNPNGVELTPELSQELDLMMARLEYLKNVRLARQAAQSQVQAAGVTLDPAMLDQFLTTGKLP